MSEVWKHFRKNSSDGIGSCTICGKKIQFTGSTTGMLYHLRKVHGKLVDKQEKEKEVTKIAKVSGKTSAQKISAFLKKESIGEVISKLAALDGFSFHALVNSSFIRSAMSEKGLEFPKNHKQAIQLVKTFSSCIKTELKTNFNSMVSTEKRFSITLDEYTSLKNRRFINVNVHQENEHWNLGLKRISGSLPAEKAVAVVTEKLEEFGLSIVDHIVCSVTDGASVMVKFGKLIPTEHQTCYAHAIHLAVQDVVYEKPAKSQSTSSDEENNSEEKNSSGEDDDSDGSDDENSTGFLGNATNESILIPKVKIHLQLVISKIRKIVKLFRKSPIKNDILQEEVKKQLGKEVSLILDCQTRWNSLLSMIQQFLKIKDAIAKVLTDISPLLICSNDEVEVLLDIVAALEPVKLAAEALCRQNATLLTAEGIFKFLVSNLQKKNSRLCISMKNAILKRFAERRQNNLVSLFKYLSNPECLFQVEEHEIFNMPSKSVLQKTAKNMLSRLFPTNPEDQENENHVSFETENQSKNDQISLQDELEEAIQHSSKKQRHNSHDEFRAISKEMLVFEATGKRTSNLDLLFNAFETIPPTSVESERAFSAAGLFVTKIRSRMSDDLLDTLCFLKAYFLKKNKS
jgi:hypothetical protein